MMVRMIWQRARSLKADLRTRDSSRLMNKRYAFVVSVPDIGRQNVSRHMDSAIASKSPIFIKSEDSS